MSISDYVAVIEKAQAERDEMGARLACATRLIEEGNLAMETVINYETALRRIVSLGEKNVPKYAQQIASEALARTDERVADVETQPYSHINECPSCRRMFVDGETCSRGGRPMGGDV